MCDVVMVPNYVYDSIYVSVRDEAERECIREVCWRCKHGDMPGYEPSEFFFDWKHRYDGLYDYCPASAIYELRRRRAEGA